MVQQRQVETVAGITQLGSVDDVGAAGMGISGGMIMDYRNGEGAAVERALYNASHIERGRVTGTGGNLVTSQIIPG